MEGGRIVQSRGTPQEIIANPADYSYVEDFVAHMNPLSVLTAADAMTADAGPGDPARMLAPEAPLRDALPLFADVGRAGLGRPRRHDRGTDQPAGGLRDADQHVQRHQQAENVFPDSHHQSMLSITTSTPPAGGASYAERIRCVFFSRFQSCRIMPMVIRSAFGQRIVEEVA